jgi:hypothetical protein
MPNLLREALGWTVPLRRAGEPDDAPRRMSPDRTTFERRTHMRRGAVLLALAGVVFAATVAAAAFVGAAGPSGAAASSHREAPLIADDPAADNTDVYAFVSPNDPATTFDESTTVTILANYIPFEDPAGGPNYYRFDPTALYELHVDNDGDARDDVTYQFRFKTTVSNPNTFLYNTNQVTSLDDTDLNVKQTYSVTRVVGGRGGDDDDDDDDDGRRGTVLVANAPVPPANIGPRSTPEYEGLAAHGIVDLGGGRKVFAGPRDDPFFVDLGSIFDLAGLRPFNPAHVIPLPGEAGQDGVLNYNTHTIAIQVPKTDLLRAPHGEGTIGIYASTSRREIRVLRGNGTVDSRGDWVQVSRLGNPLINEVVIPVGQKDRWNASSPRRDSQFLNRYTSPELAGLVNFLYPVLDNTPESGRGDLVAVLLTGVPGVNLTGSTQSDLLRLNTDLGTPVPVGTGNRLGLLAGEFTGFPNGRRLEDDVTDIEIRAIACGYGPIVGPIVESFHFCDGDANRVPNNILADGVDANENPFMPTFPYVALPNQGYEHTGHN